MGIWKGILATVIVIVWIGLDSITELIFSAL